MGFYRSVAWCRHGPYSDAITAFRDAPNGSRFSWQGRRRWVDETAIPRDGQPFLVCAADLCHEPGRVTGLGVGLVERVELVSDRWTIEFRKLDDDFAGVTFAFPIGQLVATAIDAADGPDSWLPSAADAGPVVIA